MLICPVRGCRLELERKERCVICANGHSFDVARSGYVNLLQPQDRRSKRPGDTPAAIAGRKHLHELGVMKPLLAAIQDLVAPSGREVILDAGCGDGFYLGSMASEAKFAGRGIDISVPAIDAAARSYPQCEWVVANADRAIPYADGSFTAVLSLTARMNAPEFNRVLRHDGRLVVGIPSPEDLLELRGKGRDRTARTIEAFSQYFALAESRRVTTCADLDVSAVNDVLHSIYRPLRARPVEAMRLTFSLDLLLFRPKRST